MAVRLYRPSTHKACSINPKQEQMFKAKPAHRVVKIRALKDMAKQTAAENSEAER